MAISLEGSTGVVFIGFSEFSAGKWDWRSISSPLEEEHYLGISSARRYYRESDGTMFVAVAVADGSTLAFNAATILSGLDNNQLPVWPQQPALSDAYCMFHDLVLDFIPAQDPEHLPVQHYLQLTPAGSIPGGPDTEELPIAMVLLSGDPPYVITVDELDLGQEYTVQLAAEDLAGERITDSAALDVVITDYTGTNEPWGHYRGDPARTGANPGCTVRSGLVEDWSVPVLWQINSETECQPVINTDDWVTVATTNGYRIYGLLSGNEVGSQTGISDLQFAFPALYQHRFAVGTQLGAGIAELGSTELPQNIALGTVRRAAPLLLDSYLYVADADGFITCQLLDSERTAWRYAAVDPVAYECALATDGVALYACRSDSRLDKLDLRTGKLLATRMLDPDWLNVDAFCVDGENGKLYLTTGLAELVELDSADLSALRTWTFGESPGWTTPPALALHHDPPLALCTHMMKHESISLKPTTTAVDLETGEVAWQAYYERSNPVSTAVSSDAVFVFNEWDEYSVSKYMVTVIDLDSGALLQQYPLNEEMRSELALHGDHLAFVSETELDAVTLHALTWDQPDPPLWNDPDNTGLISINSESLYTEPDETEFVYGRGYHPDGLAVHYALFYAAGHPPMLETPFTDTTVVSGLEGSGVTNKVYIAGLLPDTRYYAAVRAYVGEWGAGEVTDGNEVIRSVTVPWVSGAVSTGSTKLPTDYALNMSAVSSDADRDFLLFNDQVDNSMYLVYNNSDTSYSKETTWINPFKGTAFDNAWYNGEMYFVVQHPDQPNQLRYIERLAVDSYLPVWITGVQPDAENDVELVMGTEPVVAYSHYLSGTAPNTQVEYYLVRTSGGVWQAPAALSSGNQGGRDISLAAAPGGGGLVWAAYQQGTAAGSSLALATAGELRFARETAPGVFSDILVDAGDNAQNSDCGKRVELQVDASNNPHLAYLDLNAATVEPRGQLKYAVDTGSGFTVETVATIDLSMLAGEYQHTYSTLGFGLLPDNTPVIAVLERQDYTATPGVPFHADCVVYKRTGPGAWQRILLAEDHWSFAKDRESIEICIKSDGQINVYYPGSRVEIDPLANNMVRHRRRAY